MDVYTLAVHILTSIGNGYARPDDRIHCSWSVVRVRPASGFLGAVPRWVWIIALLLVPFVAPTSLSHCRVVSMQVNKARHSIRDSMAFVGKVTRPQDTRHHRPDSSSRTPRWRDPRQCVFAPAPPQCVIRISSNVVGLVIALLRDHGVRWKPASTALPNSSCRCCFPQCTTRASDAALRSVETKPRSDLCSQHEISGQGITFKWLHGALDLSIMGKSFLVIATTAGVAPLCV